MENTNCLVGMRCPKCHSLEPFDIAASSFFRVYDDGTESHTDVEWEDDSVCTCPGCGHVGTIKEFTQRSVQLIQLPCYGIVIELDGEGGGTIVSELHEGLVVGDEQLMSALDAIESMVLACAAAGIDITTPAFLQGIEAAVESVHRQYG